jgi:hypothetical protein
VWARRNGAESLGLWERVADGDNKAHHLEKYLFVFNDSGAGVFADEGRRSFARFIT